MASSDKITDLDIVKLDPEVYQKLPRYLYHATNIEYLDDIADMGLGSIEADYPNPFYNRGIFLAQDYQVALDYMGIDSEDVCILEIPTSILRKNLMYYDTNDVYTQEYLNGKTPFDSNVTLFYAGVIDDPTDSIRLIDF